ncbi:aldehyde dehydrogenase family protein [Glutamicibacter arilaitensis]|uniref:Betaine-aldehyde dehydrogenase n=1 Tax=Glutamicibacter arilaitensis (strain DSM 16368 / CIP 108037 / IAM 15318 / JCM 13566 / NCIMB 14258 / Re117) TaxID=861360 RepID=A0ABP1U0Q4_GLUAR|nr:MULTISPECIES: aldehyde dehydrogenase family protein [Glutamicibacter]CBT74949.1 betaine-aldehyde dehydrogenase [Glutamicibacter arilaitensis Re117]HCH49080.1 betaine-aldehyde dehydrogenase [Glutamicibacter sp.]
MSSPSNQNPLLHHGATLFIDGAFTPAASGETRTINCPANGEAVATVSEAGEADSIKAIEAARRSFDSGIWSSVPAAQRGDFLLKAAEQLVARKAEFALAETLDTGKRLVESELDMDDIISCFRYFGKLAGQEAGRVVDANDPNVISRIDYEPVGVAAMITPWNYPLLQAAWKIAPALAAGCSFVLKPAELTPSTAILMMEVLKDLGLPAGVANLVTGAGAQAGAVLSEHKDVDLVSFTGGLVTGRKVAAAAAGTVKKVALELGGKNPNVVFADADFDAALDNALNGAFVHSGQVCSAGARLVIHESIAEKFVDELVRRAQQITLGGPFDQKAETGALISAAHLEKVDAYVQAGIAEGARVRCGGRRATEQDGAGLGSGHFYLPTVIDQVTGSMSVAQDEAFGPTITVETFSTEDQAVAIANDTIYGLAGAVWSQDAGKAARVAKRLRHGTIWINDYHPYLPQAEWGGFGQSGVGRELGPTGLGEYQEAKHVYQNLNPQVTGWFAQKQS